MKRLGLASPGPISISLPQAVKSFSNANFGQRNLGSPNVNQGVTVPQPIGAWARSESSGRFNASRPVTTAINGLGCTDGESMAWKYLERATLVMSAIYFGTLLYNKFVKK